MRVRLFLRAILVLAFAGLFVAGSLSITKLLHLELPCGEGHGCDIVNSHPSSMWFGIPVAYFGFVGYLIIASLAVLRSGMAAEKARPLALVGYLFSAFGALTSVLLQIYSLTVIQATCRWCLGSAAIMILLLVFHALEYGDRVGEEVPDGKGEFPLLTALGAVVVLGLIGMGISLHSSAYKAPTPVTEAMLARTELIPKDAHSFGDKNAPITIVEFADMMCPVCQQDSPKLREFVQKHPGRIQLVFRHFPIEQLHPLGGLAAAVSEVASDQDKFWDFMLAIMATGENIKDPNKFWDVAKGVGLDVDKVKARLQNENDPAIAKLTRDKNAAGALGISSTPTFIVKAQGLSTQAFGYPALMEAMTSGMYKKLVEGP